MEYYKVFIKVLLKEIEKFQLDTVVYSTYATQLTASLAENFDVPYYRCAYMYRYATASIYFFNDCIKLFLSDYSNTKDILSMWKSYSEVKVCSLSVGPGLDYLGFMLALLEHDPSPPNFNGVKVISKHGAWRNTVNLIVEVFCEQKSAFEVSLPKLKYENVKVIHADLLKIYTGNRQIVAVSEANVILMMKTLNLLAAGTTQEGPLLHMLKELISSLKSEAIIFCIDTKPSLALLTQALSHFPGKFLYGPIHHACRLPVDFPEINGCRPIISARGAFFVWQKLLTSSSLNLCATPLANISVGTEDNLTSACNTDDESNFCTVEDEAKVEDKNSDNLDRIENIWIELKTFWNCSSPKTKEILKKLMLTNEESLEQISDIISHSEKVDIHKKSLLNITQTSMLQDIESSKEQKISLNITQTEILEDTKVTSVPLNAMQDSSIDNLNNTIYNFFNLKNTQHEGNSCDTVDSPSLCDTLNSVSSLACENDTSSSKGEERSTGTKPKRSETLYNYHASVKTDTLKISSEEATIAKDDAKISSCENKVIQTDTLENILATSSSVKALTERIKQLAISLESVSQQNEPSNYCGDFNEPFNCHTDGLHNFTTPDINTHTTAKPSCSKQSPNSGFKEQDSLPSYNSTAERNASFQNIDCHCSSQCCHSRCHMHCCSRSCHFQPCCAQPVPRCHFSCNRQQSKENNFENLTSPNIVIPLQHISDNALLQIISVLKSESYSK